MIESKAQRAQKASALHTEQLTSAAHSLVITVSPHRTAAPNVRAVGLREADGVGVWQCEALETRGGLVLWTGGHHLNPGALRVVIETLEEHGRLAAGQTCAEHWGRPASFWLDAERVVAS